LVVSFDATKSSDSDGSIVSYEWIFGDDSTDTGVTPSKTFPSTGNYNVTLTVTDNSGATSTYTEEVSVEAKNLPPVAQFEITSVNELTVNVDASKSTDDTGISSYEWSWGDDSTSIG